MSGGSTKILSLRDGLDQALSNTFYTGVSEKRFLAGTGLDIARLRELAEALDEAGLFQLLGATGHHLRFGRGAGDRETTLGQLRSLKFVRLRH